MLFKEHKHLIDPYISSLDALSNLNSSETEKRDLCTKMLKAISADPEKYDELTPLNTNWWHNNIVSSMANRKNDPESIAELLRILSRIAREATLRQPYIPKPPESDLLTYFEFGKEGLSQDEKENADFIWASMPKYIAMEQLSGIALKQQDVDNSIAKWKKELSEIETKVAQHEENLKKHHQKYNFVGLSKAFHEMFKEKKREKNKILFLLVIVGLLITTPLFLQFANNEDTAFMRIASGDITPVAVSKLLSLVALEIIFVYFFRIVLHNFYSAKAQLMQLDLRQSLCAFIESYVDFAQEKKSKGSESLSRFEAVVFSGISAEASNIPNTFDGIEQLAKLIKELKPKG